MGNLLDYLDWRGDLSLQCAPFNEVDNLILSELSYVDFTGIVPDVAHGSGIALRDAAECFFSRFPDGEPIDMGVLIPDAIPDMLRKMAGSIRFGSMKLSCFTSHLDVVKGEQFAALTIETGDHAVYCAFRGTDDTLAGWREDLELACMPEVPAQKLAVAYTAAVAKRFPRKKLRLGGHSKGGNLAVYASVFSPPHLQKRMIAVWSNDGPGFHEDLLDSPEYQRVADRILSIVPKSSVVGMLLEHGEDYAVVVSDQLGFLQHDGFSWQVLGDRFISLRQVTRQALLSDQTLRQWIRGLSAAQRESFVSAMSDVLTASGAVTLTDLREDGLKSGIAMIKAMKTLDQETRDGLLEFFSMLFKSNLKMMLEGIQEESEKKWSSLRRRGGKNASSNR